MNYEKSVADAHFLRGEYEIAAKMYHEGARDGDERAAFNYGYCLYHGIGVKRDPSEAKSFFSFARERSLSTTSVLQMTELSFILMAVPSPSLQAMGEAPMVSPVRVTSKQSE